MSLLSAEVQILFNETLKLCIKPIIHPLSILLLNTCQRNFNGTRNSCITNIELSNPHVLLGSSEYKILESAHVAILQV